MRNRLNDCIMNDINNYILEYNLLVSGFTYPVIIGINDTYRIMRPGVDSYIEDIFRKYIRNL